MGQAKNRLKNGIYFGQSGYIPRIEKCDYTESERSLRALSYVELERRVRAVHEAGHFVVGEVIGRTVLFSSISFKGRGTGTTVFGYSEDTKSKGTFWELVRKLGGAASERLLFPDIVSNIADMDFEDATEFGLEIKDAALKQATEILENNKFRLLEVTRALLLHNSINGDLAPATPEDFEIAEHVMSATGYAALNEDGSIARDEDGYAVRGEKVGL